MQKQKFLIDWHISDYAGRRKGDIEIFQDEKLSHCKKLTAWVRFGKHLIRYVDVLWYVGYDERNYMLPEIKDLKILFENFLNYRPILEIVKEAENYSNENYIRWFYANLKQISRKEVDSLTDDYLKDYFS
jgi:hypothetical protein